MASGEAQDSPTTCKTGNLFSIATFIVLAAFLVASYFWLGTAGKMGSLPDNEAEDFVEMQADAFLHGQTNLLVEPDPLLLQQVNPYSQEHAELWLWDAILYNSKYHTYWGPVPALFVATIKALTPIRSMPDTATFLVFAILRLLVSLYIVYQTWNLLGRKKPLHLAACFLALAWTNPFPYLLGKAAIYETEIIASQTFFLAGFSMCLACLSRTLRQADIFRFIWVGILWALAMSCRLSLLPAILFVALLTAIVSAPGLDTSSRRRGFILASSALMAPILIGLMFLGWYNQIRYGSPFTTGQFYQLGLGPLIHDMHLDYIGINSYLYFLRPLDIFTQFPFVGAYNPPPPDPLVRSSANHDLLHGGTGLRVHLDHAVLPVYRTGHTSCLA